jgi:hypothetical protein
MKTCGASGGTLPIYRPTVSCYSSNSLPAPLCRYLRRAQASASSVHCGRPGCREATRVKAISKMGAMAFSRLAVLMACSLLALLHHHMNVVHLPKGHTSLPPSLAGLPASVPPPPPVPAERHAWPYLQLPRNVPCLELGDVEAAHRSCLARAGWHANAVPRTHSLSCPRSREHLCVERAAKIEPRCITGASVHNDEAERVNTASPPTINWHEVVLGMAVHFSVKEARLLQAAAETWMRMLSGADIVLMTDNDDPRNASDIAPRSDGHVAFHVHRCNDCRSRRCISGTASRDCDGVREGWLARRKVLHLFVAMARSFGHAHPHHNIANGERVQKLFFFKLDPDTVLVPHNVLRLLDQLHATIGPAQPYLFGMAACRVDAFPLCHAAGGAGYGLSRAAVAQLELFVAARYPAFLRKVDRFSYGGEDVSVAFALKKQAGIAVVNCGCMYQHTPLKYRKLHAKGEDWVDWPLTTTPASFHKFKDADELRFFFECALYDAGGRPRASPRSLFISMNDTSASKVGEGTFGGALQHVPCTRRIPASGRSRMVLDWGYTKISH